jgi:hypothetical protein
VRRYLTFGWLAAFFCGAVALLFLIINSAILARGAARWALSDWDRLAYMAVAATVPWVIALMPFLAAATLRQGKRWRRPTAWTWVISVVWIVFVLYNILGAGGAMNFMRTDVLAHRQHDAGRAKDMTGERERLVAARAAIPAETRPAPMLRPLLAAEEAKPAWKATDGCRTAGSAWARRYCAAHAKLASELGAAEELDRLTAAIAALDKQSAAAGVVDVVDPAAQFWAAWTGMSIERVQAIIPLATPIVLEIGSMVFLSFALLLAGFQGHRQVVLGGGVPRPTSLVAEPGEAAVPAGVLPPPVLPPRYDDPVTRGRELAVWFFSECTRPVPSGGLPEAKWYEAYGEQCARSNDTPVALEEFRALARKHGAVVTVIDGQVYYERVLPLIPAA